MDELGYGFGRVKLKTPDGCMLTLSTIPFVLYFVGVSLEVVALVVFVLFVVFIILVLRSVAVAE